MTTTTETPAALTPEQQIEELASRAEHVRNVIAKRERDAQTASRLAGEYDLKAAAAALAGDLDALDSLTAERDSARTLATKAQEATEEARQWLAGVLAQITEAERAADAELAAKGAARARKALTETLAAASARATARAETLAALAREAADDLAALRAQMDRTHAAVARHHAHTGQDTSPAVVNRPLDEALRANPALARAWHVGIAGNATARHLDALLAAARDTHPDLRARFH